MTDKMVWAAEPGLYPSLPAQLYHSDPCPLPSLSSHIAHTLLKRSPRHAWTQHPRLNPNFERTEKKEFDIGTVAHGLMLGQPIETLHIIDAPDYKKKSTQATRNKARSAGLVPLLKHQAEEVATMVAAGQMQLLKTQAPDAFQNGKPEQTLVWIEKTAYGPIWCRSRLDYLSDKVVKDRTGPLDDYKTTGGSADSDTFFAQAWDLGYYMQAAFYMRAVRAVTGIRPTEFRFIFQETDAPYALTVNGLRAPDLGEADMMVEEAIDLWGWCMKNDSWPGYPGRVAYSAPPPWAVRRIEARKERHAQLVAMGEDPKKTMIDWQRPLGNVK